MDTDKIYAKNLANEYTKKENSKVEELKKLDAKVKLPVIIFTYTFGIISSLILGIGMCLSMHVIGNNSTTLFVIGIILGVIGIALISINYPIYKKLLNKRKERYAFEIIKLAKEISE